MRYFILFFSLSLLISCTEAPKKEVININLYNDFSLNFMGLNLAPPTIDNPNNSMFVYNSFIREGKSNSVKKYSLTFIGTFIVPPTLLPNSYSGILGNISIISASINDEPVMTLSGLQIDSQIPIKLIENKDWKSFWRLLSEKQIEISNSNTIKHKISCTQSSTLSENFESDIFNITDFIKK